VDCLKIQWGGAAFFSFVQAISAKKGLNAVTIVEFPVFTLKERRAMNKEELIQEVAKKTKTSQKQVDEVLVSIMETVVKAVSKGKKVTLIGFGTFEPRKRAARTGRNPQTGKELVIAAKTVPAFSPGKKFKETVAKK
jgi:DNA-binding protein HU-beta